MLCCVVLYHDVLGCRTTALSIDEVEAQMRSAAGGGAEPARLLPKSMRQQMQESAAAAAAEKQLQEDVAVRRLEPPIRRLVIPDWLHPASC